MKSNAFGLGAEGILADQATVTGTTPLSYIADGENMDGVSFVVRTENVTTTVPVSAGTDNVVASTHTWTFAGFNFTGMAGAKIHVSGAANSNNNGVFTIASVTSSHVIVTGGTQTNETFGAGVSVFIERSDVPLAGAWTCLVSNDCNTSASYNGASRAGFYTDITSQISNFPGAFVVPMSAYIQLSPITARSVKLVLTPASGQGLVSVYVFSKGNR